jgi:uncharacterized membrane protein YgcG
MSSNEAAAEKIARDLELQAAEGVGAAPPRQEPDAAEAASSVAAKDAADEKEAAAADLRTATGVAFLKYVQGKISRALQPRNDEEVKEAAPYVKAPYTEDPKIGNRANATAQKVWDFKQDQLAEEYQDNESRVVALRLAAEAKIVAKAKKQAEFVADNFFGAGENLAELDDQHAEDLRKKWSWIEKMDRKNARGALRAAEAKQAYLADQLAYAKGWATVIGPLEEVLESTVLAEYHEVWPDLLREAHIVPCPGSFKFVDPQRFGQAKLQARQKNNNSAQSIPRKEPLPSSSSNAPLPGAAPSSSSSSGSSSSSYSGGNSSSSSYNDGRSSSSSYSGGSSGSSRDYGNRGNRDRDWDNRYSDRSRKPAAKRSFPSAQQAPNKRERTYLPACPEGLSCAARGRCGFHHSNHDLLAFLELPPLPPLPFGMPSLETHPAPEAVAVAAEAAARAAAVASAAKVAKTVVEVAETRSDVATALAQHKEAEGEPVYSPLTSNSDEEEGDSDGNYVGDETDQQKKR